MRTNPRVATLIAALAATLAFPLAAKPATHPGQDAFVREVVEAADAAGRPIDAELVAATLAGAKVQQSILDAISRPAEKTKPWRDYRPIFVTPQRIDGGVAFYRENRALLRQVSAQYGVPPEIIVAIIGVETSYGRITGKYRVLDALATLAFHYPPRAPFFRGELKQLFLLDGAQFPFAIDQLTGSYAGAMGWGQFMPSSWARYARDYDGDGHVDLWNSKHDIFASIANYFVGHGWETGQPVVHRAEVADGARALAPDGYEPVYSVGELADWGYSIERGSAKLDDEYPATLLVLDGAAGKEHWITHKNFFVITRYNRSPMYAMAVNQLAGEIAAGIAATGP